jgi:hypothetical protein
MSATPSGIRVTVYAGESAWPGEQRPGSVVAHNDADVAEVLRHIGLEYKTADYFPGRQVVITIDPIPADDSQDVRAKVREAAIALEETGLL